MSPPRRSAREGPSRRLPACAAAASRPCLALGGLGGVAFLPQLVGSVAGAAYALGAGLVVYGILKAVMGLRLSPEDERRGADLSIHAISANPELDLKV